MKYWGHESDHQFPAVVIPIRSHSNKGERQKENMQTQNLGTHTNRQNSCTLFFFLF